MASRDDLPEALVALASSFRPGGDVQVDAGTLTLEQVRSFVSANVARLLDENPGILMSILYRIDIDETNVRHVFESEPPSMIVERLTTMIMERQLEKVRRRREYRERDTTQS